MEMIIIAIIRIVAIYVAYRMGRKAGLIEGVSLERLRREQVELRVRRQIDEAANRNPELWETEIDA